MKNKLTFILTFLISAICFAQNGINYKAVIKDNSGVVVANQAITVEFSILKGTAQANMYKETHNPTTNANGIISIVIGEGTLVSGNYSTIDWGSDNHFLNVQVNTGSGLINMGTTQFGTVPYALNVKGAPFKKVGNLVSHPIQDDFLFGTAALSNQTGTEQKIIFDHSKGAIRAGMVNNASWDDANIGSASTAFGFSNEASGAYTFAVGSANKASANNAVAIGTSNIANGLEAIALGKNLKANAAGSTILGRYNVGGGDPNTITNTGSLLEVGNGNSMFPSNALTILNNGTITAPSFDLAEITVPKALVTKEYADANLTPTGLETLNEGNGIGWRLKGRDPANYNNIGLNAVDFSTSLSASTIYGASGNYSKAFGLSTQASGLYSTAIGNFTKALATNSIATGTLTTASGESSTAMGHETTASGFGATTMGRNTVASEDYATATGYYSNASGEYATAMGHYTHAEANNVTAIGKSNVGGGSPIHWIETDPLFEIGIGSEANRANALTVLKNGKIGIGKHNNIGGMLEIQTNSTFTQPQLALIEDNADFAHLKFKNTNRNGDDYWDIAGFIGTVLANDRLNFNNSDGGDIMILNGNGDVTVQGSLAQNSDRRLKRDIETIKFGIAEILQLNPVQYNWIDKENKQYKSLGVIAQEIEEIIPNVVQKGDDEAQTLSVSYTELIPVLIKAIQEQQKIINNQKNELSHQSSKIEVLSEEISEIQQLTKRINQLENNQKKVQKEAIAAKME